MPPRIAIPVPTTADADYNHRSWPTYAHAIRESGGEPVEIALTLSRAALREVLATCHGICLPGSPADVDPALYGQDADPATAPPDPARDNTDRALLEDAFVHTKPVLAVCFGLQSLNVWRGGTLVQDLTPLPVNHAAGGSVAIAHAVQIVAGSLLSSLLDTAESSSPADGAFHRLPINSSHHQAVAIPGDGLRVVARCPEDGVVEAVELDIGGKLFHVEQLPFLLGVQWHPERSFDISATSRNIFSRLVREATAKQAASHRL